MEWYEDKVILIYACRYCKSTDGCLCHYLEEDYDWSSKDFKLIGGYHAFPIGPDDPPPNLISK